MREVERQRERETEEGRKKGTLFFFKKAHPITAEQTYLYALL